MEMENVLVQLEAAQAELDPQFRALRGVMGALKTAVRLTSEEQADALSIWTTSRTPLIWRGTGNGRLPQRR